MKCFFFVLGALFSNWSPEELIAERAKNLEGISGACASTTLRLLFPAVSLQQRPTQTAKLHKQSYTNKASMSVLMRYQQCPVIFFFLCTKLYVHVCDFFKLLRSHECFSITYGDTLPNLWRNCVALSDENLPKSWETLPRSSSSSVIIFTPSAEQVRMSLSLFHMLKYHWRLLVMRVSHAEVWWIFNWVSRPVDSHTALHVLWQQW